MPHKDKDKDRAAKLKSYHKRKVATGDKRRSVYRARYKDAPEAFRAKSRIQWQAKTRHIGQCPICGIPDQKLCWDHDHSTGRFRSWICNHCNKMLGFARDDIYILLSAVAYLKDYK